jgi:hypothetical protein
MRFLGDSIHSSVDEVNYDDRSLSNNGNYVETEVDYVADIDYDSCKKSEYQINETKYV